MVKGFAVGRTIFSNAAQKWLKGEMTDEQAVADMAQRFQALVDIWNTARARAAAVRACPSPPRPPGLAAGGVALVEVGPIQS